VSPAHLSRRAVLGGAAATGLSAVPGAGRSVAGPVGRRVAVLGGGVGGLTAAHELAERGFTVTVFETRALGGKARSVAVPGTGADGRADLPGEHGFRFFPGFYHHLPDTLRRIPFPGNRRGVWDNLVTASTIRLARRDAPGIVLPLSLRRPAAMTADALHETLASIFTTALRIPADEALHFANRLAVFLTSSDARRFGTWEHISWSDFIGVRGRSAEYNTLVSHTLTSSLVAAKADLASARTIGAMGEQFLGNPDRHGDDGPLDRVLDGPTNEAWLDPWVRHLRNLGVRFVIPATVRTLEVRDGRIAAARIAAGFGTERVWADYFVLAVPTDRARALWTPEILALRPELADMRRLYLDWMNGCQFYLRRSPRAGRGHIAFVDSAWSLTGLTQNQFWRRTRFPTDFGDGTVADCLSVDISDWNTPGPLTGKPAARCAPAEIAREVWAQVRAHFADTGTPLRADDLHSWTIDPGIGWHAEAGVNNNADPLLINTAGSWLSRPTAHGGIENLFLASDYVRTNIDLATMEGANEAARDAVNALLDVAGSDQPRCAKFTLYRPPELDPMRRHDADRYARGLPNLFDVR
jgi:uncharacterized protein with NAD-binding domain and iron-sulfur cluster